MTTEGARAVIAPVLGGAPRPRWSVMIPTYNGTAYLEQALRSVLSQDPGPEEMQIEVVDDCSTEGDPAALVTAVAGDRVGYHRQPVNLGYIANFEACLQRSRGHLVHLLHDDDAVRPGFYDRLAAGFDARPDIGAAFCRSIYVDPDGHWNRLTVLEQREPGVLEDWLWKIATGPRLTTPSLVVHRRAYESVGGFDRRQRFAGEDWEMWVRLASRYPVWYEPEPLALYRVRRPASLTSRSSTAGEIVAEMRRAAEIIESYLPEHLPDDGARRMTAFARMEFARWSVEEAEGLLQTGRPVAAARRAREAWRTSPRPTVAAWLVASAARVLLRAASSCARRVGGTGGRR